MSNQELIVAYSDGQMSRRVFIRRLLMAGVSVGAAVTYAQALAPGAAARSRVLAQSFYETPEPTPDPTPEPTPDATPEPTPTSEPTPTPDGEPDTVGGGDLFSDDDVLPGEEVTFGGGGFDPDAPLRIEFRSDPVILKRIRADGDGRFRTTITIPADAAPGAHRLSAIGPGALEDVLEVFVNVNVLGGAPQVLGQSGGAQLPRTGADAGAVAALGGASLLAGRIVLGLERRLRARAEEADGPSPWEPHF